MHGVANVKFEDYSFEIIKGMKKDVIAVLEECAGELESQAKMNTRVDTGKTKNDWAHEVDERTYTAYIGNTNENAIWEEFGTGEHALKNNGRKGGWWYQDARGEWHHTYGKKPSRAFFKAYNSLKNPIQDRIRRRLKGI